MLLEVVPERREGAQMARGEGLLPEQVPEKGEEEGLMYSRRSWAQAGIWTGLSRHWEGRWSPWNSPRPGEGRSRGALGPTISV